MLQMKACATAAKLNRIKRGKHFRTVQIALNDFLFSQLQILLQKLGPKRNGECCFIERSITEIFVNVETEVKVDKFEMPLFDFTQCQGHSDYRPI
jgi:hypothetical protein